MLRRTKISLLLLAVVFVALPAWAQKPGIGYSDAYCSGFTTHRDMGSMYVVAGDDKDDTMAWTTSYYIFLSQGNLAPGSEYLIVRRAKDPMKTNAYRGQRAAVAYMGQLYVDIARVKVAVAYPNVSAAQVVFSCEAIWPGDIVIPAEARPMPEYRARKPFDRFAPPSGKIIGSIVNARDFQQFPARGQYIHIDLSSSEVKPGDYLRIFRYAKGPRYGASGFGGVYGMARGTIKKKDLPREVLGEAMVIRTEEKSAVAIITYSQREIILGDYVELE